MKEKNRDKKSNELHKQIEKFLDKKRKSIPKEGHTQDVKKLLHELHVYQIELEMQNEELRKAQVELEASRTKYADLYDFAPVGYFTFDQKGLIVETNLTGVELLGVERHLLTHKPFSHYIMPEFKSLFHSHRQSVFAADMKQTCELKLMKKDLTSFHASLESIRIQDSNGNFQCRSIINDITERKRMEEELRILNKSLEQYVTERTTTLLMSNKKLQMEIVERKQTEEALRVSEGKYRLLIENLPQRIFYKDKNLRYVSCNKNLARDLHIKPYEIKGKTDYDFYPTKLAEKYRSDDKRIMESGQTEEIEEEYVKDGRELIVHVVKTPIKSEKCDIIGVLGIFWDITEKIVLRKEMIRSGHLASLGELAADVAHEINNPITGVINCAQILFNKSSEGSKEKDLAGRIVKEGDRIAYIVSKLLSFARFNGGKEEKSIVSIHQIMSDTLILTEAELQKEGIKLNLNIPKNLPKIVAHPQEIQQVFLNIISNARYALNQKYQETHDNKILEILGEEIGMGNHPDIKITFYDHGTGIPANIIDKAMNPFFTTKPTGIGTGLGLSISHSIVSNHGGKLTIESVEGEFTKVAVILPVKTKFL